MRPDRKPLLLVGSLGQALMLDIMAIIFGTAAQGGAGNLDMQGNQGLIALLAANGYIAFFAFSRGTHHVGHARRDVSQQVSGAALSVCGVVQWLSNFLITVTFPVLLDSIGLGFSYGIYAAFGVVAFFFVRLFIEETKGRTLEDMSREVEVAS